MGGTLGTKAFPQPGAIPQAQAGSNPVGIQPSGPINAAALNPYTPPAPAPTPTVTPAPTAPSNAPIKPKNPYYPLINDGKLNLRYF